VRWPPRWLRLQRRQHACRYRSPSTIPHPSSLIQRAAVAFLGPVAVRMQRRWVPRGAGGV
jgi:hypothetical protein